MTSDEIKAAVASFLCFCGRQKRSGFPFCGGCYGRLATGQQRGLYTRNKAAYDRNYTAARKYISETFQKN